MKNTTNIDILECDVIVVGSGGTGSQAVQAVAEEGLNVIVISKDPMSSSDTKICEGVMTVRESGDIKDTESLLRSSINKKIIIRKVNYGDKYKSISLKKITEDIISSC